MNINFLNPEQKKAVTTLHGPVLILAGAGTGKTRVITYRIANLLQNGIAPSQITALTFTNKAAKEMKERIGTLLDKKAANGLSISTFHSFCLKILRNFPEEADLHPEFAIVSPSEAIDTIKKSLEYKSLQNCASPYDMLSAISLIKNRLLTPEEVTEETLPDLVSTKMNAEHIAAVYQTYQTHLKLNRAIDFDDCILKFYLLLRNNPSIKSHLHSMLQYFMVDEFQDTNHTQLELLHQVVNAKHNICVVGDDDQSIYGFRGVLGNIFEEYEKYFPGCEIIKLEQNYRCTDVILKAADAVIKHNTARKSKTLWGTTQSAQKILISSHANDLDEARFIAKKCMALSGKGLKPSDMAVLYRANNQTKSLEFALRELQLPYRVFGGSSVFERKEVKDFLAYIKLSLHPTDRLSFLRIINTPNRGIGIKTLERIVGYADENKISPFEVAERNLIPASSAAAAHGLKEFCETIRAFQRRPIRTRADIELRGEEIIKEFGLLEHIRDGQGTKESKQRKIETIKKLPKWLGESFQNMEQEGQTPSAGRLLDHLLLDSDFQKGNSDKETNTISLMTIHSAKGLEFHSVFICGLEEESLPHKNSLASDAGIEEERRLFYVAITRAKAQLFMSYAHKRSSHVRNIIREPSRFIEELPKHVLEWHIGHAEEAEADPEERKKKNMNRLSMLKERLQTGF